MSDFTLVALSVGSTMVYLVIGAALNALGDRLFRYGEPHPGAELVTAATWIIWFPGMLITLAIFGLLAAVIMIGALLDWCSQKLRGK